jgi:hypothetical protein
MKTKLFFILIAGLALFACQKSGSDGEEYTLSQEDEAYYNSVLNIQEEAVNNLENLLLSTDTISALILTKQFFESQAQVTSATVGSQGIAVEYSNGMGGGIFFNPEDYPEESMRPVNGVETVSPLSYPKSGVNNKKVIFLNPSYWERAQWADGIIQNYNQNLPRVFFSLQGVYKDQAATLDRFASLSGYGVIHVYSHGWAWPTSANISDVYLMTGEVANLMATAKYWSDMKKRNVIMSKSKTGSGWKNIYFIKKAFITSHNDFSKDTVLFYGGFCYSFLGSWSQITSAFAKGSYFGFTWSVRTSKNAAWNVSLVDSLCDTVARPGYTSGSWIGASKPSKSYWDNKAGKTVSIQHTGDASLSLILPPYALFSWSADKMQSQTVLCNGARVAAADKSIANGFPITEWEWYFQNGTPNYFNGKQPPAIYFNTTGTGGFTLIVKNSRGSSSTEVHFSLINCK